MAATARWADLRDSDDEGTFDFSCGAVVRRAEAAMMEDTAPSTRSASPMSVDAQSDSTSAGSVVASLLSLPSTASREGLARGSSCERKTAAAAARRANHQQPWTSSRGGPHKRSLQHGSPAPRGAQLASGARGGQAAPGGYSRSGCATSSATTLKRRQPASRQQQAAVSSSGHQQQQHTPKRLRAGEEEERVARAAAPAQAVEHTLMAAVAPTASSSFAAGAAAVGAAEQQQQQQPVSEEVWQVRGEKREGVVAMVRASEEYQHLERLRRGSRADVASAPRSPDPWDRNISKRRWEDDVRTWRAALRSWSATAAALAAAAEEA